jgi:DUF1009 family protein
MTLPDKTAEPKRYGLIAGWGNYPLLIARSLKREGHSVFCLGVAGHADGVALRRICDVYQEMGLGRFGAAVRFFRKYQVAEATMAGKVFKKILLRPGLVWRHLPDLYTFSVFFPLFLARKTDLKDDTLLITATKGFEKKGVKLLPATNLAPNLLLPPGDLTRRVLAAADYDDVRMAWPLAREIGRLDFGQAVMVKNRRILAIEGIDGTDDTIARAGVAAQGRPFTIVKVAKPCQDMRFDVPAVGVRTLEKMVKSGADILIVEANRTLCVDPLEDFVERADSLGIAVVSLSEAQHGIVVPAEILPQKTELFSLTKARPTPHQMKDILCGLPVMRSLLRFGVAGCVTIRERSVLAVQSMGESVIETILRTKELAPDGFTVLLGRSDEGENDLPSFENLIENIVRARGKVLAFAGDVFGEGIDLLLRAADARRLPVVRTENSLQNVEVPTN